MHQWQSLNLTSWTLLVSLEVRQCKLCYCTRVKLRFLPVYIESLTISSQEPLLGKQVPKQVLYFVKVNTNGKLETRTKGIADECSDLTCTKKYDRDGGWGSWCGPLAQPSQSFYACYGPVLEKIFMLSVVIEAFKKSVMFLCTPFRKS